MATVKPPPDSLCDPALRVPPTLMYHSVSPSRQPDPHRLRVHPARLDRHLGLLRRLGLRGAPLTDVLDAARRGGASGLVGLTFDDGYADFHDHAAPILARHGMTGTVYVVAGLLGGVNEWDDGPRIPLMDAKQVRAVASAGHEIGSHTVTHARIAGAAADVLTTETVESRRVLQDVLHAEIKGFAYPYGDFDAVAVEAVRSAGYDHACVTGDYRPGGRFAVPRCYISPADRAPHVMARIVRHYTRQRASHR